MKRLFIFCVPLLFTSILFGGTTGTVRGVVLDGDTNEPIGGTTVIATSVALQGEEATLSDEKGLFYLTGLPAGIYNITVDFAGARSERNDVKVSIDKTVSLDFKIFMSAAEGEVYTITEEAPNVDVASATQGVTVTKEYIEKVPLGRDRNFDSAMSVLPSSGGDEFGTSVGGTTSPENSYVIDGLNTTDPSKGLMGSRLVMEFIDEFDLKEGGYGPEFGRATGGLVNVVTKSGSNEFHGSAFLYYRPNFFQATPREVKRANDSIGRKGRVNYYLNMGGELGGPIVKDKLWFHVGYSPELQSDNWRRTIFQIQADPNGDGPLRDANNQFVMAEDGQSTDYDSFAISHQYTAKLTHSINSNNRHSLGVRGSPIWFDGVVTNPFDPDSPGRSMNADPRTFHFKQFSGNVLSAVYNFAGQYFNDKLKFDGILGWYRQESRWNPTKVGEDDPRIIYMYEENLDLLSPDSQCGTFADGTPRCRVRNYAKNGFGSIGDLTLNRIMEKASLTHLFDLAGLHQFKYGLDFEQVISDMARWYTGGGGFQDFGPGKYFRGTQYYIDGNIIDKLNARTGTMNYALFAQDAWNPSTNLTLNFGLRWEAQDFLGVKSPTERTTLERKFGIYDNFAPRVGGVWDFLNNGRSRVFANFGRYYESIPTDLNERAFGGEGLRIAFYDRESCRDENGAPLDALQVTNPEKQCDLDARGANILGGEDSIVAPGLKGQYADEIILGVDVELFAKWIFGISGTYRYLGRVIEDVSTDNAQTYMFANPGEFDLNSLNSIKNELAGTTDPTERARLQNLIDKLPGINSFNKPVRDYWSLQFKLDKKLSENLMFLATYVVSWAWGNYPGLFSSNNGQLDPNLTSQYDLPQLLINRMGFLPQDRRHRIKLTGFYSIPFEKLGIKAPLAVTIGTSFNVQSGRPHDVLGADELYGSNEIFVLPRGDGGRLPWTWSADINVGVEYQITNEVTAEVFGAFYNVTNNQATVAVDDTYTYDTVKPIEGGTKEQLAHLRNDAGAPVKVNPNFGKPTSFQAPFSAQVGFRLKF